MPRVPAPLFAALVFAALIAATPIFAQPVEPHRSPQQPPADVEVPDIVREGARRVLEGIRRLVDQMPMFEPPRVTSEGDIILKRIRPPALDGEEARSPHFGHEGVDL